MKMLCLLTAIGSLTFLSHPLAGEEPAGANAAGQAAAKEYFALYGVVASPGRYELKCRMNVEEAILVLGGGIKPTANLKRVKLIRKMPGGPANKTILVNLNNPTILIPEICAGDVIIVDERLEGF